MTVQVSPKVQASPIGMACEPIEKKVGKTAIKLQHGDQTALEVDAIVFYAREDLQLGSGYGTAIQGRGGASIQKELDEIGGIKMGESVVTAAGSMENTKQIIHSCGPKFQEPDIEEKLRDCMRSSLKAANKAGIKTLAFPPMGTGFYGIPLDLSADIMLDTIKEAAEGDTSLEEIIICVIDYRDFVPFSKRMESL